MDSERQQSKYSSEVDEFIDGVSKNDLKSFEKLDQQKKHHLILESCEKNRSPLNLALSEGHVELGNRIIDAADEMNQSDYEKVVCSPDEHGNTPPLVAAIKVSGDDGKKFWEVLKRLNSHPGHLTIKNNAGESVASTLVQQQTQNAASNYDKSKVVEGLMKCGVLIQNSSESCGDCNQSDVLLMEFKASNHELKKVVEAAELGSASCGLGNTQGSTEWSSMQSVVDDLPHHELTACLLSETEISAFEECLKISTFEAVGELLGNTKCKLCLQKTLMSSYWKMRFRNLNMGQDAIKAFDTKGYCKESYLIPMPSEHSKLSRPLAMMFYDEGRGGKVGAEKDTSNLAKAFKDGLGWRECSVQVQPKEFNWSGDALLKRIEAQLEAEEGDTTNAKNCSLFILFISCHGSAGAMKGSSFWDEIKIEEIMKRGNELLPRFIPKVFIIDACQVERPLFNPNTYIREPNTLLLMATVRGEYAYGDKDKGGVYARYLVEEIERGNDSLQNMHCRAAQRTMSHEIQQKSKTLKRKLEEDSGQVAVLQSTTAKKIFLRKFNHADGCNKQGCLRAIKTSNSVTCINCTVTYHVECVPPVGNDRSEVLPQNELAQNELTTLQKRGVYWFCPKCVDRLVRL